jgi:hypothetical protein
MSISVYWNNELKQISYSNIPLNTFGEFDRIIPSIFKFQQSNNYNNIYNKPWYNSGFNIINSNSDFIGIGTSNPKQKLDLFGNLSITGSIISTINSNFNLGSSNLKWKNLYLSSNSSYFINNNINCSNFILNDNSNNFLLFSLNNNQLIFNSNNSIFNTIYFNDYSNIIYSNILLNTSNKLINDINSNINNKINNNIINSIITDNISIGTSNKFIINNIYNSNITFTSNFNVLNNLYYNNYKIPLELNNSKFFYNYFINNSNIFDLNIENDFTIYHKLSPVYNYLTLTSNYHINYFNKSNINWSFNYNTNPNFIGINNSNPLYKLDIIGDINFNGNLFLKNQLIPFNIQSNTNIISSNSIQSSNCFIYYTNGSITFPQSTSCDILIVGAGGNGGIGSFSGGGGAGEVIAYPNFNFNQGTYNINVGISSFTSNNRISKITSNLFSIYAIGGGNGAYSNVNPEIGGSGGGGYSNIINGATAGNPYINLYSFISNGTNGTISSGGNGGSSSHISTITGSSLIVGVGGIGATSNSIPQLKDTYGSGGDGNGGLGTQGIIIIKIPYNIQKSYFNGYIDYSNIIDKPNINQLFFNNNIIDTGFNNQINFPNGITAWNNQWFIYIDNNNSLTFWNSNNNTRWFFSGSQSNINIPLTNSEISDGRIKKEINDINNPIEKLLSLQPKEYYLCDDKDYLKKYGLIAQDISNNPTLNHLVYNDIDFIANIYSNGTYFNNNNSIIIISDISIIDKININDEIKLIISKNNINNTEIIIDDLLYHNRFKKRFCKVKKIIDNYSFEIFEDLNLSSNNNLFIYGKKVNNFNKLDYSSLYSLNIAGNQEIYKLIQSNNQKLSNLELRLNEL